MRGGGGGGGAGSEAADYCSNMDPNAQPFDPECSLFHHLAESF